MRKLVAGLGVAGVIWAAEPPEADACSCAGGFTIPGGEAGAVPRNPQIVLAVASEMGTGSTFFELRRASDGALVPAEFEARGYANYPQVYVGHPLEPLEPNTTYEVYPDLPDSFPASPLLTFTTGTEIDVTAPEAAATALHVRRLRAADGCQSSCWSGGRLGTDFLRLEYEELAEDVAYAIIEHGPEGQVPTTIIKPHGSSAGSATLVTSDL